MGILSSFYNKLFGPAQPVSTFYETDRYNHYFGSNEFKPVGTNPISDSVLNELTRPKPLKALIPRKVGLWKTTENVKWFSQPVTIPASWTINTVDGACAFVTGGRPIEATGRAISWLGSATFGTTYRTCFAAGRVWNNYAPNEWAIDGAAIWNRYAPSALSWSPEGDEALAKKIEMHEVLANNNVRANATTRSAVAPQTLYTDEVKHVTGLNQGDIEGYNKHLRKVYGDERIGLLFRRAQAHLNRTSRFEVRKDYASQAGIKDKTKMQGFQANFNLQLKHLPKAIESASAAIDELLKAFSSREAAVLNEITSLKAKLAEEEARMPSLDKLVERLLSIPEVTESLSLHQAVLALPRKVNNPEQFYLAIQGLSKVMFCLKQEKSEENAEKIDQTEADLYNLEQFWPVYSHLKEALSAYEEISKLGKDLRTVRKDILGTPESFKDTFEKHPKTLLSLVRAFETLREVENLPTDMKDFSEYFVSTLKESIHIRAVAAAELARILHYGLEINPMDIPGLYTDLQSDAQTALPLPASVRGQIADCDYRLSAMPIATVFKPLEFPDMAEKAMEKLKDQLELLVDSVSTADYLDVAGGAVAADRARPVDAYNQMLQEIRGFLAEIQGIGKRNPSRADLQAYIATMRPKFNALREAFQACPVNRNIAGAAARNEGRSIAVPTPSGGTRDVSASVLHRECLDKVTQAFVGTVSSLDALDAYAADVYESSKEKRARIGKMLKDMQETAKKELADSPYKTTEELLFRASLDFRFLDLFLDQGSKEKDKRLKDLDKFFESMMPAWTVDMDPEEAVEKAKQEELRTNFKNFLKEIVPGIKSGNALADQMTSLKLSVEGQLKNTLELLENTCGSAKAMDLIVACLDDKNPKRHHAFGNLYFRGVGVGQFASSDPAGKNESSLVRYRQALDLYAKAVNEALEYRVGFDENPLVTGDDVNTFRHATKKAAYFLQSAEAMVRCESLLKNAQEHLNTEGPSKPDREMWVAFVDKLLRRLNAAIAAEEKMTGVVIAEHWLFQDYGQGPAARNEDGSMLPQDGLDARAAAHLARVLARKGVFGVLDPEVEEMVKNIPPKPKTEGTGKGGGDMFQPQPPRDPNAPKDNRDYAQENRAAQVEYLRPAVRMHGHAKNPSNLMDLYRWKSILLDSIRRPEDADIARRNALQRKEEGIIDKKDFFFDEKKFQELYKQFGGIEEREQLVF